MNRVLALVVGGLLAAGYALAAVAPGHRWLTKEGPLERVQLVALGAAVLLLAFRRGKPALARVVGCGYLILLIGEEIDWGGVGNLHNQLDGHAYGLFALPLLALFAIPRVGAIYSVQWTDRVLFFIVVGVVPAIVTLFVHSLEGPIEEVKELGLHVQLTWLAWRNPVSSSRASSSDEV